jgi:deoxyadenosine/deoxycytidine kinase
MPVTAPETPLNSDGLPRHRYIVVEGPVGIGKSALAKVLAERWAMTPDFEQPGNNPFLERFYRDPARHALAVQTHFLLERTSHAAAMARADDGSMPPTVGDFLPQKDALYARLNLDDEEFALYQRLASRLESLTRVPDLVIYLQASPETLFARIQKRTSGVELQISDAYLRALCDAYNSFFYHYDQSPLLTVNMENLEPSENDADLALLLEHIGAMRGPREFFVKGSL